MANAPEFSIIIATYNRARELPKAIESVLAQTHKEWELIVVDDGSIDETAQLMDRWNDSRIKYVRLPENSGASHARNRGIETAKGRFVMIWDSDDELFREALASLSACAEEYPDAGIISSPAIPVIRGEEQPYEMRAEGYVSLPQILCKYLPDNEKIRAARRELFAAAKYRSRNLDFMVNGYLAEQAPWYHLAKPLGKLRIDGSDSLTAARRRKNAKRSAERAPHLDAYLSHFGPILKQSCARRYGDLAYGAAIGSLLAGKKVEARKWSSESLAHRGITLRSLTAYVLARLPGGRLLLSRIFALL